MTTVTIIEEGGGDLTVEAPETTVQIEDSGAPGATGPAHESYPFTMQADLEVVTDDVTEIPMSGPGFIESVQATLLTAPGGQEVICDVELNRVSIWTDPDDRPVFDVGEDEVGPLTVFDTDSFDAGDKLRVIVPQIGTSPVGRGLCLVVRVRLS